MKKCETIINIYIPSTIGFLKKYQDPQSSEANLWLFVPAKKNLSLFEGSCDSCG